MSLQYKPQSDKLIQLNYRYASKDYINQNLNTNKYGQSIKQVGGVLGWELTDKVSVMTSYYHDLALKNRWKGNFRLTTTLAVGRQMCMWLAV